jgi:hypothetical protein
VRTDFVPQTTEEGTSLEREEGTEGLLIRFMEGLIPMSWWALEKACERDRKLWLHNGEKA